MAIQKKRNNFSFLCYNLIIDGDYMDKNTFKSDLLYLLDELDKEHICLYYTVTKKEILDYIDYLLDNLSYETTYDQMYIVRLIIKKLAGEYDQHMRADFSIPHILPFNFKVLENELYLVDSIDEFSHLVYKRLISINGISADKIIDELDKSITYNVIGYRNSFFSRLYIEDILMLPSIESDSKVLDFKFDNGEIATVNVDKKYPFININNNYSLKKIDNALYLKFPTCRISTDEIKELIVKIKVFKEREGFDCLIIDLRGNGGGNDAPLKLIANYIKDYRIKSYTLVDGATFSAAAINAFDLKMVGTTLVGEEIGESLTNFGNLTKDYIVLPNSNIHVKGTYKFFYPTSKGINVVSTKKDFKKLDDKYKKLLFITLDKVVNTTIFDIKKHEDPVLKYVLEEETR